MMIKLSHGSARVDRMPGQGWYLTTLWVDRDYRCKGIGTRLMSKVLAKCGRPIYLMASGELGGDPAKLKEFYSRFGFVPYKERRGDNLPYNANMVLL